MKKKLKQALLVVPLICTRPMYAGAQNVKNPKTENRTSAQISGNSEQVKNSKNPNTKKKTNSSDAPHSVIGILLPGESTDLASSNLAEYTAEGRDMDTVDGTYRSQLYATIKSGVTVGKVNKSLISVGARITFIAKNSPVITIQVPDPGSAAALQKIAVTLENSGAFDAVSTIQAIGPD